MVGGRRGKNGRVMNQTRFHCHHQENFEVVAALRRYFRGLDVV